MKHLIMRIVATMLSLMIIMLTVSLVYAETEINGEISGIEFTTSPTIATVTEPPEFATEVPSTDLAFSGASLTLQDNLCINYKANETLFTEVGYENPYVIFELNGEEFTVTDYEVVSGKYVFDFADISPANMNDTVKATLYATFDGIEHVSETREYSVATYCYNMLSKYNTDDYAELRTLLVDLLNYGAQTQIYTDHNTDNLVNANLTAEQTAWGTSEAPTYETVQNLSYSTIDEPIVTWKGGGLNLEDSVTMRFKISAESTDNLTVKAETDTHLWTISAEEFEAITGGYYVYFDGLDASQMSEPVYLTVYEGDTPVSNTICYSVESYAYSKQSSTDTNLVNLLEAMMKYGNSASAYVNPDDQEEDSTEVTTTVPEVTESTEEATEPSSKKTIYFSNNKNWSKVNIFFWGGSDSTSWPGVAMEYVGLNDIGEQVYKYELDLSTPNIIFNNGSEQTVDILENVVDGKGFYLTEKNSEGKYNVSAYDYIKNTGDTITLYFENTYGWSTVYCHGWNEAGDINTAWPGDPMENVSGNIYSVTVDASLTYVIFNDGTGKVQTADLVIPGDNRIYSSGTGVWSVYDLNGDGGNTITIYVEDTNNWGAVYWHGWNTAGGTNTAWPGDPMENVGGNIYKANVDASFTGIVFNNNNGAQTSDLTIPGDNQIYNLATGSWSAYNGD